VFILNTPISFAQNTYPPSSEGPSKGGFRNLCINALEAAKFLRLAWLGEQVIVSEHDGRTHRVKVTFKDVMAAAKGQSIEREISEDASDPSEDGVLNLDRIGEPNVRVIRVTASGLVSPNNSQYIEAIQTRHKVLRAVQHLAPFNTQLEHLISQVEGAEADTDQFRRDNIAFIKEVLNDPTHEALYVLSEHMLWSQAHGFFLKIRVLLDIVLKDPKSQMQLTADQKSVLRTTLNYWSRMTKQDPRMPRLEEGEIYEAQGRTPYIFSVNWEILEVEPNAGP